MTPLAAARTARIVLVAGTVLALFALTASACSSPTPDTSGIFQSRSGPYEPGAAVGTSADPAAEEGAAAPQPTEPAEPDCAPLIEPPGPDGPAGAVAGYAAAGLGGACAWSGASRPLAGVPVELVLPGPDLVPGTADDEVRATVTGPDGCFAFSGLPLPLDGLLRAPKAHEGLMLACDTDGGEPGGVVVLLAQNAPSQTRHVFGYEP